MSIPEFRQPMLAPRPNPDLNGIWYPMWASTKMDGIRCLVFDGHLLSRTGKEIPNGRLRERLRGVINQCSNDKLILDGELWSPNLQFNQVSSVVMSYDKDPQDVEFWAFDCLTYSEWIEKISIKFGWRNSRLDHIEGIRVIPQIIVSDANFLQDYYDETLADGHEGLIVRSPVGLYKWGRCTTREQNMFKMKATEEFDAKVVGYEPLYVMRDGCDREVNELGRLKSVHRADDKVRVDQLGKLLVRDEKNREFAVGTGFTDNERKSFWDVRDDLIGQWIKVKSASAGVKDLPRHPIFISFRDPK